MAANSVSVSGKRPRTQLGAELGCHEFVSTGKAGTLRAFKRQSGDAPGF
jgi:hypothetical protein